MLFNSVSFLIFLPIVLLIYYIFPNKYRYLWLLVSSYYFYMCWNASYIILILFSTVITYGSGLLLQRQKDKVKDHNKKLVEKCVLFTVISLNLLVLFYFKYANFTVDILHTIANQWNIHLNIPTFDILLPVGISFYTFQALSYSIDVYRNEIDAEKNFFRYALFVAFFPQLVAGPIERSKNLLTQLRTPQKVNYQNIKEGFLIMLWGFFLKLVIADRIAIFVNTVYGEYQTFPGMYLVIATILFAIQIYCDFYGYSVIALGTAKLLGIQLMENFHSPYLSTSVSMFWKNWHISLTSWFKDYVYIPLGGSKKGTTRKYLNKIIVFLISGLWHGAAFSFIVWGLLNGLYQVIGEVWQPIKKYFSTKWKIKITKFYPVIQVVITFILIDFSWIFFRANSFNEAIDIIRSIFTMNNTTILLNGLIYEAGLNHLNFLVLVIGISVLLSADIAKKKSIQIHQIILGQTYWIQCIVISLTICIILVFGVYGLTYDSSNFIYFQF